MDTPKVGGLLTIALGKRLGAGSIERIVLLAPASHGTTYKGLTVALNSIGVDPQIVAAPISPVCGACADLLAGSPYVKNVAKGGRTVPGINYSVLALASDQTVTPGGPASFIREPGVLNVYANKLWPREPDFTHGNLPQHAVVNNWISSRLSR